jgi:predicted NBD/HSP70 family sugar kinase
MVEQERRAETTERPPAPQASGARRERAGAVGVHIGGTMCRAAAGLEERQTWRSQLPPGGVDAACDAIVEAVQRVVARPRYVVVGSPGHVDRAAGTVSGAANLGEEWAGTVRLGERLAARLGCEVDVRNDAETALEAERRLGGLVAVNDGALITLSTGVGVALLVNGRDQPTELGHSIVQFDGPACLGRPHRGCYESFLGGWALPLRYRERRPEFAGAAAREIPDDEEFWADYGARLGELIVMLCLLGQRLEVDSLVGQIALARGSQLLPAVQARVQREASLLGVVPRQIAVTPLGDDVHVLGALLLARDLLYPFGSA